MSSAVTDLIAAHIKWKGSASIHAALYDIGNYPGAVPSNDPNSMVRGEVIELMRPENVWKILDKYEGCDQNGVGREYSRQTESVQLEDGEVVQAWVYWYNLPVQNKRKIDNNDYLQYLRKNQLA